MIDPFGREIRGIRVSLTQRCNLNCIYCHHEGEGTTSVEMTTEEVLRILGVAASLGINRVKFTGGEPLLRSDLTQILRGARDIGMEDVALTTNGSLLKASAPDLAKAGLRRLNISLPSLRSEVYHRLTGGKLEDALDGARAVKELGMEIKLNLVVMKGVNVGEVEDFLALAKELGGAIQLIELEDLHLGKGFFKRYHQDLSAIEKRIARRAWRVTERDEMNRRTRYYLDGLQVDLVRPIDNPEFCSRCTRLRVTSDGKLKPCLMRSDNLVDLLGPMRRGCSDAELERLFRAAVSLRSPYYRP